MQANDVEKSGQDLATRLASLDPIEFDSAINQYFEANARWDGPQFSLSGASRIKQLVRLQSALAKKSQVAGIPHYDALAQKLDFVIQRTYQYPQIPAYIPFASSFSNRQKTVNWDCHLLLHAGEGAMSDNAELFVTKVNANRREQFPFESLTTIEFLRPVINLLMLLTTIVTSFLIRHPLQKEGPAAFTYNAAGEVWDGIWTLKQENEAKAQKYASEKQVTVSRLLETAQATATVYTNEIEARARQQGIHVDELKQRAYQLTEVAKKQAAQMMTTVQAKMNETQSVVKDKVAETESVVQERADETQSNVREIKRQVAAKKSTGKKVEQRVLSEIGHTESISPESAGGPSIDAPLADNILNLGPAVATTDAIHDTPRTPLGGHNPLAGDAPSYAEAAMQ